MNRLTILFLVVADLFLVPGARSAVTYSGVQNVAVPLTFDGVWLNIVTGATTTSLPGTWNTAAWINPFFGGVGISNDNLLRPVITGADQVVNLAAGTVIDAGGNFVAGESLSSTHTGGAGNQFAIGTAGYIGFQFQATTGGATQYGWLNVTVNNAGAGVIRDWGYDDAGGSILAGRIQQSVAALGAQTVTLSPATGESFTLGSAITDTGGNINSVSKIGDGTTVLAGSNSYTGTTTVDGGVLKLTNNSTPGTNASGTVVNNGGTIELGGTLIGNEALTLNGTGKLAASGTNSWAGTITVSNSVFDISSGTTTLTGQITGTGGITKLGAGTLELADTPPAANNFTGQVIVNAGSLVLDRATPNTSIPETAGTNGALPLGSRAIEINGGTLVLAQAAQIGDTRTMLLNGGTFDTGGFNETLGALTLQSNSVIDFGSSASLLSFANSSSQAWNVGSTLSIWNWSGTPVTGGGADQLLFGPGGLTLTQASQIAFYSGAGGGFIGMGTLVGSEVVPGVIVPVPEPSAALSAMGLIMLIGWRERGIFLRRRRRQV